jgi:hypothetical protein
MRDEVSGKYSGGNVRSALDDALINRIACGRRVSSLIGREGGSDVKAVAAERARGDRIRNRVAQAAVTGTRPTAW